MATDLAPANPALAVSGCYEVDNHTAQLGHGDLAASQVADRTDALAAEQLVAADMDPAEEDSDEPLMDLRSGYVQRAAAMLPRQGTSGKWRIRNNYLLDMPRMRLSRIDDGAMTFTRNNTGV